MLVVCIACFFMSVGCIICYLFESKRQYALKCQYGILEPEGFATLPDYEDPDSELSLNYAKRLARAPDEVLRAVERSNKLEPIHLTAGIIFGIIAVILLIFII